jgi:hypothetical protein
MLMMTTHQFTIYVFFFGADAVFAGVFNVFTKVTEIFEMELISVNHSNDRLSSSLASLH